MNYLEIRAIMAHIRKKLPCPICGTHYKNENIDLVGVLPDEGLFHLKCHKCKDVLAVNIAVNEKALLEQKRNNRLKIRKNGTTSPISENDILDMKNFLTNHKGDLSKYLK